MVLIKSEQIKVGLQKSFCKGNKASTVCYGCRVTSDGNVLAYPSEAIYVIHIFDRFAADDSLKRFDLLVQLDVFFPTGEEIWSKETISKILSNEKYFGNVVLGKTEVKDGVQVKTTDFGSQIFIKGHHPTIISKELFELVQKEKKRRATLVKDRLRGAKWVLPESYHRKSIFRPD